jgi:hypothetical protein
MSTIAASPNKIPMLEYVRRMLAEAEAKEAADKLRRRGSGQVIQFPANRIIREIRNGRVVKRKKRVNQ